MVAEWALMRAKNGLALNFYGPSTFAANTPSGQQVSIKQTTDYPVSGNDAIRLGLAKPEAFELKLRIPAWSAKTRVSINGRNLAAPPPGAYLSLDRQWKNGDTISIQFDMSLHFWAGEREYQGLTSIYHGPLLLAFDPVDNTIDPSTVPELAAKDLQPEVIPTNRTIQPLVLLTVKAMNGQEIKLCDFATAGAYGNVYRSWLPVTGLTPLPFDSHKPVWNNRPH
jgi:uncharacterized protein